MSAPHVSPDRIGALFFQAMSAMRRDEAPAYGSLLGLAQAVPEWQVKAKAVVEGPPARARPAPASVQP